MTHRPIKISVIVSLYDGIRYLGGFLADIARQTIFEESEFIIVHNQPTDEERALIAAFGQQCACHLRHITVPREPLYASWNRGIEAASADILTVWNVDDTRPADSLERQAAFLAESPVVALTYGDFVNIERYGDTEGPAKQLPEFNRTLFLKKCKTGPFVAWRKRCAETVGLFDEQFKSAGDYDYWARIATHFPMQKTPGPALGYFLNEKRGLSTDNSGLAMTERNVVNLRYGNFDRITYRHLKQVSAYRIGEIRFNGAWNPVGEFIPDYHQLISARKRRFWFFSMVRPLLGLPNNI